MSGLLAQYLQFRLVFCSRRRQSLLLRFFLSRIKCVYHDGLLNQSVAVFTHVLQDFVSSIVAGGGGRLGGHSEWVDQSLEVNEEQQSLAIINYWSLMLKLLQKMSLWLKFYKIKLVVCVILLVDDSVQCLLAAGG